MKKAVFFLFLLVIPVMACAQEIVQSVTGEQIVTDGNDLTLTALGQIRGYGKGYDSDIYSPKSATFSKDGKKLYINSLEGCKTVVYDVESREKIKTIPHSFTSGEGLLWSQPSGFYEFTHYTDGQKKAFRGKPVEAALTPDGKYLFVPYYRRDFDLNAQDPSALAVIDTEEDEIIRMFETGPLPKMVRVSHNGDLLAITHWGDNTVGFIDISDKNPDHWHHLPPVVIGKKLNLNYSLTTPVNRDSGSGFLLRGTVFLPGDSILLVSGMSGPLNIVDAKKGEWIGTVPDLYSVRHITLRDSLLYMSRNSSGEVVTVPVNKFVEAISSRGDGTRTFKVDGIRKTKVGGGARTLKVSPSGRFIFVACNSASSLFVVRTEDMKVIGSINADSYPVGLDISPDGTLLVSTSQGINGKGGNAVDFFEIKYSDPDAEIIREKPMASDEFEGMGSENSDRTSLSSSENMSDNLGAELGRDRLKWMIGFAIGIAILAAIVIYVKKNKD